MARGRIVIPPYNPANPQPIRSQQWGNLVWDQSLQTFANAADRDAQWPSPHNGAQCYLEDTGRVYLFVDTSWRFLDQAAFNIGVPLGAVIPYFGRVEPPGQNTWRIPNGQQLSRTDYAALFALIGTIYGAGNGTTTFHLPNCQGRFLYPTAAAGGTDTGSVGGATTHTLTAAQMPAHTHLVRYAGQNNAVAFRYTASNYGMQMSGTGDRASFTNVTAEAAGSGQAHNILNPFIRCQLLMRVS